MIDAGKLGNLNFNLNLNLKKNIFIFPQSLLFHFLEYKWHCSQREKFVRKTLAEIFVDLLNLNILG